MFKGYLFVNVYNHVLFSLYSMKNNVFVAQPESAFVFLLNTLL